MGLDDDADCPEHVWRLVSVVLGDGADAEYRCVRCGTVTLRTKGQPFPGSV